MNASKAQELINNFPCKEGRAKKFECNYFADEVRLVYESSKANDVCCKFTGCFKVNIDHIKKFKKLSPVKNMIYSQVPYFLFNIDICDIFEDSEHFLCCKIDMGLLEAEIWCKNISVEKIDIIITEGKQCFEY